MAGLELKHDDWDEISPGNDYSSTITNPEDYTFGVEIELVATPKNVYDSSNGNDFLNADVGYWRRRLADRMNKKRGLHAVTSRRPRDYDRWYIMNDSSLQFQPRNYQVALEAVSPKMYQFQELKKQINLFWEAATDLFDIEANTSCGTHIHVAPLDHTFTLEELRRLAYAVATQEKFVLQILPQERIGNDYCRPCSFRSEELRLDLEEGEEDDIEHPSSYVAERLEKMRNKSELIDYIQSNNRYVLWNFKNTQSQSGTVEFRGGRHMRGPVRTKRWIAFTVAFVTKAIRDTHMYEKTTDSDIDEWWQSIRFRAIDLRMDEFLPGSWSRMRDIVR